MAESPFKGMEDEDMLTVEGIIEQVIYSNEENGYSVCELCISDAEYITLVGIMPFVAEGETICANGNWTTHPSFGRQFKVSYFEKQLPKTQSTILKYLSSRTVKGIGPKTAKALVNEFGEDTFDVIENHPDWVAHLPGISLKKAQQISENFKEQFGMRSVMLFCRDYFGPSAAVRIYHQWGLGAIERIKENPYMLCREIYGVGFEKADKVAHSMGIKDNAAIRIMAAMEYLCRHNAFQNGHVYLPEDRLLQATEQMVHVTAEEAQDALAAQLQSGAMVSVKIMGRNCIYLKDLYEAEKYVCSKMDLIDKTCPIMEAGSVDLMIDKIEQQEQISYAKLQRRAIAEALANGIMILTGGPGTGKTTVIRAILRIFDDMGLSVALVAPTGRAAKRMSEATQNEAKTLHRLLEMEYNKTTEPVFKRDQNHLLDEQVIVVDEASMVDLMLMNALLKAVRPGAHLILIGDSDQLPPVGAGYVLHDLIKSDRFSTIQLKEIFRQARESLIVTNAHAINAGEMPELHAKDQDFFFLPRPDGHQTAMTVASLCLNRLPASYGDEIRTKIQVISPSRKGEAGTEMLNEILQSALNPPGNGKKERTFRDHVFRTGDKVMQVRNNYDIEWERRTLAGTLHGVGIFNGDIGEILDMDFRLETMTILFDDKTVLYDFNSLEDLDHAYAITVHKSQGSEYPVVIMPVYPYTQKLLTRNLLYTAVTRASEMVILVGDERVIQQMVGNNRQAKRYSGLGIWLNQYEGI